MPVYIAMLRGINVGGHNKVLMADLRTCLSEQGFSNVATYIQSGNVVFQAKRMSPIKLGEQIEGILQERFGFPIPVIIRSSTDMAKQLATNPFLKKKNGNPDHFYFVFADKKPKASLVESIEAPPGIPESFEIVDQVIYLLCPVGTARSKLTIQFFEKNLGVRCTARNMKTVNTLKKMAEECGT